MKTTLRMLGMLILFLTLVGCAAPAAPTAAPVSNPTGAPASTTAPPAVAPTARPLVKIRAIQGGSVALPLMCYQTLGFPEALGFYKEEGVEVENLGVEGGTAALQALVAGKGDVVSTTPASMAALITQGLDPKSKIVYVYGRRIHWEIDIPEDSALTQITDLKGKKIGVTSFGASPYIGIQAMLKEVGLDPKTDVTFTAVGTGASLVSAINSKQIDVLAATTYEAASAEILGVKFKKIPLTPSVASTWGLADAANSSFMKDHPDALVGYLRAITKGLIFMFDNPEACVKIHWKLYPDSKPKGVSDEEALQQAVHIVKRNSGTWPVLPTDTDKRWGYADPASWTTINKVFGLDPSLDISKIYTMEYIDAINNFDQEAIHKLAKDYVVR